MRETLPTAIINISLLSVSIGRPNPFLVFMNVPIQDSPLGLGKTKLNSVEY